MPSLEEIAEEAVAVAITEKLEPEGIESREIETSEIAEMAGYEPGQISRAWKEADLEGYDVDVWRVGRKENTIQWKISYDSGSESLPSQPSYPDRSERGEGGARVIKRLEDYGVTVESDVFDPDFTELYLDVVEKVREEEEDELGIVRGMADHHSVKGKYDSIGKRVEVARKRINELEEAVEEFRREEKQVDGQVKTFLSLE